MFDRIITMLFCTLLGFLGGLLGGTIILLAYLLGSLLLGTHPSESLPPLVGRITVPLGGLVGFLCGALAK